MDSSISNMQGTIDFPADGTGLTSEGLTHDLQAGLQQRDMRMRMRRDQFGMPIEARARALEPAVAADERREALLETSARATIAASGAGGGDYSSLESGRDAEVSGWVKAVMAAVSTLAGVGMLVLTRRRSASSYGSIV
jgi:hypothetical protein